jgi:hypothetical protein
MVLWKYIYQALSEPPQRVRPRFNYAMLAFILLLLAWYIYWLINLSPDYRGDRYGNAVVDLMLLFNVLAFGFRWPIRATVFLRTLAFIWLVFGLVYVFYLVPHPFHKG